MNTALHMGWRYVLFANWPVSVHLNAHLPSTLTLDTYDSDAWLSVIPSMNVDVRPTWIPDGCEFPLHELDRRTYVTYDDHDGVYVLSLDAQGILDAVGARLFHHSPYYYTRCSLTEANGDVHVDYYCPGATTIASPRGRV